MKEGLNKREKIGTECSVGKKMMKTVRIKANRRRIIAQRGSSYHVCFSVRTGTERVEFNQKPALEK